LIRPGKASGKVCRGSVFDNLHLSYRFDGQKKILRLPQQVSTNLSVHIDNTDRRSNGFIMDLVLTGRPPELPLELISFHLELQPGLSADYKMMVNGFQSWSRSTEMGAEDRIAPIFFPARPLLAPCGGSRIYQSGGKRGRLHSWTYTYFSRPGSQTLFIGSLDERSGYTFFEYDFKSDQLFIRKDCKGAQVDNSYSLLKLYIGWGALDSLFDEFMQLTGRTRPLKPKAAGWCSWYNYYTTVSEEIINENLADLASGDLPLSYFQIDDGWQKAIGDWTACNEKFPSGMQVLCNKIKEMNFEPGLWLAPFICVPSSEIFKQKPQWLLRDHRGKPVKAGFNPNWEGFFYALDFYAPGFQDHLGRVFDLVQKKWGYKMLKLDFLYATALLPRGGLTRGRIMTEAIDFIDQQTGESVVLGCGVPLGPSFGKVDYCRIGSDVGPYWEDYLKVLNYPERVSVENSLACTIGRKDLDNRAFRNDPDVFILRDGIKGSNWNRLSGNQRYTLFLLNNILGGLLFFSDDLAGLTPGQLKLLKRSFPLREVEINLFESFEGLHRIEFKADHKNYLAYANLRAVTKSLELPGVWYFSSEHLIMQPGAQLELEPYQSACFYKLDSDFTAPYLIGATGHLFPGAQIEKLVFDGGEASLVLHPHASRETKTLIGLPAGMSEFAVNKISYKARREHDLNFIIVSGKPGDS